MNKDNTVGLDLGDRFSHFCVLDEEGAVIEEDRVRTNPEAVRERFGAMGPLLVAMEVGTHSPWMSRVLAELGHEVVVANPAKLRMIYRNPRKSDKADAMMLARVARMDRALLSPIEHRSRGTQQDLQVLQTRDILVKTRTRWINHMRGLAKALGYRFPKCSAPAFHKQAAEELPDALRATLGPLIELLGTLTARIVDYDKRIERLSREKYPQVDVLREVPGVGPITALAFVLTLEDPKRFAKSRDVGPYLGLVPRRDQSGDSDKHLRITKAGDRYLRWLLVNCAHYILGAHGPDSTLRRWGLARCAQGGRTAKKRAVVAVARKLAVMLHRLWSSGEIYEPFYEAKPKPTTH
jgi:transposase